MEVEVKICKVCKFKTPHIVKGMFPAGRDYRYVDAFDRLWSGKTCPTCHAAKATKRAQEKRAAKNVTVT